MRRSKRPGSSRSRSDWHTLNAELRGFAFEGAAMGLALLDCFTPWRKDRWPTFTERLAEPHIYMMHVGLGGRSHVCDEASRRTWPNSILYWVGSWSMVTVFTKAISIGLDTSNGARFLLASTATSDASSIRDLAAVSGL